MTLIRPMAGATVRALLEGFSARGVDADAVCRDAGVERALLDRPDAQVPGDAFPRLWQGAWRRAGADDLFPTEVGLAIPFGSFGAVDYLAGSSSDVESAFHALASHFRHVATQFTLDVTTQADGSGLVRLQPGGAFPGQDVSDEFTVAVLVGRFRGRAPAPLRVQAVRLTRSTPSRDPARHARLLGAAVEYGCAVSALELHASSWKAPMATADAALQRTLRELASRLDVGDGASDLVSAVRARLRSLLPEGGANADAVARQLGMSPRTLQRRLGEEGTSFTRVLDAFREAEAERLIARGTALAEAALLLGFSDQTAWNRAFRRWKGMSPTRWAARHAPGGGPPG